MVLKILGMQVSFLSFKFLHTLNTIFTKFLVLGYAERRI